MTEATTTAPVETKNEAVPELMPDPITFTDAAVAKVKSLMDEEGNPDLKLRVLFRAAGVLASNTDSHSMKRKTMMMP